MKRLLKTGQVCFLLMTLVFLMGCSRTADRAEMPQREELSVEGLLQAGHFDYELSEQTSSEDLIKNIRKTSVNITKKDGIESGSGFIYRITPEYVYIASVDHVLTSSKDAEETVEIQFADDTVLECKIAYLTSPVLWNESAMFVIPTEKIPWVTLLGLKQVRIDNAINEKMSIGTKVKLYCENWNKGQEAFWAEGEILDYDAEVEDFIGEYIISDIVAKAGCSGAALVDQTGTLMGVLYGGGLEDSEYYKTDELQLLFERADELVDICPK